MDLRYLLNCVRNIWNSVFRLKPTTKAGTFTDGTGFTDGTDWKD